MNVKALAIHIRLSLELLFMYYNTFLILVELIDGDVADFKVSEVFLEVLEAHIELSVFSPHIITLQKLLTTGSRNVLPRRRAV